MISLSTTTPGDTGVVVLEYASEGRVVATGTPYANRYISVLTIADRKVEPLAPTTSTLSRSSTLLGGPRTRGMSWGGLASRRRAASAAPILRPADPAFLSRLDCRERGAENRSGTNGSRQAPTSRPAASLDSRDLASGRHKICCRPRRRRDRTSGGVRWPSSQRAQGIVLAHFIVSDDVERSRRFYTEVLGGRVVFPGPAG